VGLFAGAAPRLEPEDLEQLDERAAMADWDVRLMQWMHEQGLKAMRESGDAETRAIADRCNCFFCTDSRKEIDELRRKLASGDTTLKWKGEPLRPVPGRGREGLG
jgi:hypothetical protein